MVNVNPWTFQTTGLTMTEVIAREVEGEIARVKVRNCHLAPPSDMTLICSLNLWVETKTLGSAFLDFFPLMSAIIFG